MGILEAAYQAWERRGATRRWRRINRRAFTGRCPCGAPATLEHRTPVVGDEPAKHWTCDAHRLTVMWERHLDAEHWTPSRHVPPRTEEELARSSTVVVPL